jgi:hypothetical protein
MCRGLNKETSVSIILLAEFLNSNEIIQLKSRTLISSRMLAKNTITLAFTLPIQYVS